MSVRIPTPRSRTSPSPKRALPRRFSTLYRTHYDFIWRCALRLGVDPADVDDVVQETFVIALRRLDEFTDEGAALPSTWLFTILRNVLRNHARGQRRRHRKQQAYAELRADRWVDAVEAERALGIELLDRFLASLDPDRRSVFVLGELEGHDSRAIGEALGINHNTARTRLRAARKAFADAFEHDRDAREALGQAVDRTRSDPPRAEDDARERVLQAIVVGAPLELVGVSGSSGLGLGTWLGKLTFAGLATIATITTVELVEADDPRPVNLAQTKVESAVSERPSKSTVVRPIAGEPAPVEVVAKVEPRKVQRPAKVEHTEPAADDEPSDPMDALRILTDARAALGAGRAEEALRLIQVDSWSDPALADRARALEIGALCALDRGAEAKAIAEAHADRWLLSGDTTCW